MLGPMIVRYGACVALHLLHYVVGVFCFFLSLSLSLSLVFFSFSQSSDYALMIVTLSFAASDWSLSRLVGSIV